MDAAMENQGESTPKRKLEEAADAKRRRPSEAERADLNDSKDTQNDNDTNEEKPVWHGTLNWDAVWTRGVDSGAKFDEGGPTKSLDHWLASRPAVHSQTAYVPGCGRGWDVANLAKYGYAATGLELSGAAIAEAKAFLAAIEGPLAAGRERCTLLEGDFFKHHVEYDLVFDVTFLCAFEEHMGPAWAEQMARVVRRGGHLVTCIFPICPEKSTGPPWKQSLEAVQALVEPAFALESSELVPRDRSHLANLCLPLDARTNLAVWRRQ